ELERKHQTYCEVKSANLEQWAHRVLLQMHLTSVYLGGVMASCYSCGTMLPTGQGIRKTVHTGSSVGGFNLSSNVLLNWGLNNILNHWILPRILNRSNATVRSFYSVKTLCASCAGRLDLAEKRKLLGLLVLVTAAALIAVMAAGVALLK